MKSNSKLLIFLLVLVCFVLAGLLFSGSLSGLLPYSTSKKNITVKVAEAKIEKLSKYIGASGSSEPSRVINILAPSNGSRPENVLKVENINIKIGDKVKEGDILARLSNNTIFEEVAKTEKDLYELRTGVNLSDEIKEQKREYLNSIKSLYDKGFANRNELETARNSLSQSEVDSINLRKQVREKEALLNQLLRNREGLEILSPIEGVVIDKEVEIGQILSSGHEMFSIGAILPLNVVSNVSQEDINDLYIGQNAEVSFNFMPGISFEGRVVSIYPSVDLDSQTTKVIISLENKNRKLIPGLLASIRFKSDKEALVVPRLSVLGPFGENNVFVLNESKNKVHLNSVITGQVFLDGQIEIIDGLTQGQKVVISNVEKLEDGISVRLSPN